MWCWMCECFFFLKETKGHETGFDLQLNSLHLQCLWTQRKEWTSHTLRRPVLLIWLYALPPSHLFLCGRAVKPVWQWRTFITGRYLHSLIDTSNIGIHIHTHIHTETYTKTYKHCTYINTHTIQNIKVMRMSIRKIARTSNPSLSLSLLFIYQKQKNDFAPRLHTFLWQISSYTNLKLW